MHSWAPILITSVLCSRISFSLSNKEVVSSGNRGISSLYQNSMLQVQICYKLWPAQIIVQQILLFLGGKTPTQPTRLLISEIFLSKPDFQLYKWKKSFLHSLIRTCRFVIFFEICHLSTRLNGPTRLFGRLEYILCICHSRLLFGSKFWWDNDKTRDSFHKDSERIMKGFRKDSKKVTKVSQKDYKKIK